jgi:hypothetical protein
VVFGVGGWPKIMAAMHDSYPYTDNKGKDQCMTNEGWSHDPDNTGAQVIVTLYY